MPIATFVAAAPETVDGGPRVSGSARFVLLLLDNLIGSPQWTVNTQRIARLFAGRMQPGDTIVVVSLDGGHGATMTNRREVLAAIDRFKPAGDTIMARPRAHALQTIADLMRQMAAVTHRRKAIVCIGRFDLQPDGSDRHAGQVLRRVDRRRAGRLAPQRQPLRDRSRRSQ